MWKTVLVFDGVEIPCKKDLPPLREDGEILKYKVDTFDKSLVPCVYKLTKVIFDIENVIQYAHGKQVI